MTRIHFTPFPLLSTERLLLRQLVDSDDQAIFLLRTNNSVNRYIERPIPTNTDEALIFIQNINEAISRDKSIYWVICLRTTQSLIGTICLWNFSDDMTIAELGYELMPEFQGQGIMNEALRCVITYAFETLKLEKLEAFTHKDNLHSTRLLVKNNFTLYPGRIDEENINTIAYILKKY